MPNHVRKYRLSVLVGPLEALQWLLPPSPMGRPDKCTIAFGVHNRYKVTFMRSDVLFSIYCPPVETAPTSAITTTLFSGVVGKSLRQILSERSHKSLGVCPTGSSPACRCRTSPRPAQWRRSPR